MRIHLDTNLLISEPRWELLPPGEHEFLVSALVFAEFSEGTAHPDPDIAARVRIDLIQHRSTSHAKGARLGFDVRTRLRQVFQRWWRSLHGATLENTPARPG